MLTQHGIGGSSFAGGTEIMFQGTSMTMTPQNFRILVNNTKFSFQTSFPLNLQDNAFNSQTATGKIEYTFPSASTIFQQSISSLQPYDTLTFDLGLYDTSADFPSDASYLCPQTSLQSCRITMSRAYTPILYYLSPRVIYDGSDFAFYLDPKVAQNYKTSTELFFTEARVDNQTIDFENYVDTTTLLQSYVKNQVRGISRQNLPSSSADVNFKFKAGNCLHDDTQMTVCSFDNQTCYKAKVVPVITSISASTGYTSGGQILTVQGYGFNTNNISVTIDGILCVIKTYQLMQFTCETGANTNPSTDTYYIGQQGLKRQYFNTTTNLNYNLLQTTTPYQVLPALSLEAPQNQKNGPSGNIFSGYFKAPATSNFRFYMSCDDSCFIKLSNVNKDPTQATTILTSNYYSNYRDYFTVDNSKVTNWINLLAGSYYYIEVQHLQSGGGDHLTVSVEADANQLVGHQHSLREIQRLQILPVNIREKWILTFVNPDGGNMIINILNPYTLKYIATPYINVNSTASQMKTAMAPYFLGVHGADIAVELQQSDATGQLTNNPDLSVKNNYTISVLKSITGWASNYVSIQKKGTNCTILLSFDLPWTKGSLPISGSFQIKCALPDGTYNYTVEIPVTQSPSQINDKIVQACPQYRDKLDVSNGPLYPSNMYSDGRDLIIRFIGFNNDPVQFEIQTFVTNPLKATNITLNSTTQVPYSTNVMYEPIPFEFLYTAETKPSVLVSVNGLPAVCNSNNMDCGYNYAQPTPLITSFGLTGTTLTIAGTSLNLNTVQSVNFANSICTITSISETQIICTIPSTTTGIWSPKVVDTQGVIPVDPSFIYVVNVPLTVNGVSPQTALNPEGENILTITGQNFPPSLTDGSTINITLSDGTYCHVFYSTPTLIKCLTDKFSSAAISVTGTVIINNQSDSSLSLVITTAPAAIVLLTPSIASPVLKTNLTLQVGTSFTGALDANDIKVSLVDVTNSSKIKAVNVITVDNTLKTITVRYGGAYSGNYQVVVRSVLYGKFNTDNIILQAIGKILDYNPKKGSINGGTLITVSGFNFSNDILDNPIRVGKTDCIVQTSSNNQITCRLQSKREDADNAGMNIERFLVFLKTSEEAVCATTDKSCNFEWISSGLPFIDTYSTIFYPSLNDYELVLTGSSFPSSIQDVYVSIDGFQQTIISATPTEIRIQITNILDSFSNNVVIYFPNGTPDGYYQLQTTGITLTPTVISISPQTGSPAGSLITAIVKGVGINTKSITITMSDGTDICKQVTISNYGVVKCLTNVLTIATNTLNVKVGTTSYSCTTPTQCTYQTSTSMPSVTALSLSSDKLTLTLTGSNYFTTGYAAKVTYASVAADSIVVNSATSLSATWNKGLPLSNTALYPVIWFERSADSHWATVTANFTNTFTLSSIDSNVQCSFAGGCSISLSKVGLSSSIVSDNSNLTICGVKALLSVDSTTTTAKFILPQLATTFSISNYNMSKETYLIGSPFSSSTNPAQAAAAFDMENMNGFADTTKSTCYIGTSFTTGHVGFINEVKYFMPVFNSLDYVGKLILQGSLDGINYSNISIVGNEIHEGWNYYTYPSGSELKFRFYRFYGTTAYSCGVGEIGFRGVEVINDSSSSYSSCPIQLTLNNGSPITLSGTVTYTSTKTPLLTSINPRWGQVQGGETITFTGTNFVSDISKYTLLLDNIPCVVQSASSTQVQCITGKRPGLYPNPSIIFRIEGYGNVATQDFVFRYVNYWSNTQTWGDEFIPMEGDTLYIPAGLNLLVDVDSTPLLGAVLVEGSLIFPSNANPNHQRTFDAYYVMVSGGLLEVGTEQFPYTSKLTITMHGNKESPEIPIYGNKVIAVRNGILDLHGIPRYPTWTELDTTVLPGATQITLHTSVDWKAGERIVIAPSGYDNNEAEEKTIVSVDRTNVKLPVINLDSALIYKHYAAIETYGTQFIEMRSEVALLTRNVIYRGDPETSHNNQFGAHIMLHSHGDESLTGRIEYCEFTDVGQAFQLGRYPIHFHMIGTVHNSYIRGNSISNTYNRAVTFHGVHYLRVTQNVAYNTMGHTFFIEDAIETKNFIEGNLAIKTKASFSLLITDQTPASFWITNPDNIFRGNHAAGSDRYGYWFDTKPNPMGPSFTTTVCPENAQLGEFTNNVAHSNGKYGLRIFHKLISRVNPCQPIYYNATNLADPYASNPLITAKFINFTSWKNKEVGAIAEQVGDVRFINFKVADHLIAGIEFSLTKDVADGYAQISKALVIGHSKNAEDTTLQSSYHGIITPRTENFQVNTASFYNFDLSGQAALGSCSHCFHGAATDSGARTITFSGLFFDSSVTTKIRYQFPYRDIFYDTDGTLTGLGPKTWATPYFEHNVQPECKVNLDVFDGILCDSTVQVRRLAMWNSQPSSVFNLMEMKVLKYDDNIINAKNSTELQDYILNTTAYGFVPFKPKQDPANGWAVPYVTGHKYKVHWRYGLDFDSMNIDLSSRWQTTDKGVYLIYNFTDVRARVDVITGGDTIKNETLTSKANSQWQSGDNVIYNDTEVRQIHLSINGKNQTRQSVQVVGYRCDGPCMSDIVEKPIETTIRRWSDPASWDSGKLPIAGESVEIQSGWNMLYDLPESPILSMLEINGRLTFENDVQDLNLKTKYIFIRAGELIIGTQDLPFTKNAQITLFGEKQNQQIVFDNAIEAGNKIIANTNLFQMFGLQRSRITRLLQTAQPGSTSIFVEANLDWKTGDRIGLAPTSFAFTESEYVTITTYNIVTGEVQLDRQISYYHYGASISTASKYGGIVDIRGEAFLLSRNIRIVGDDTDGWGGQILTSDFYELTGPIRKGNTILDNVEIYNCSQYDTEKAALRFQSAQLSWSKISNSAIYSGYGWGVNIDYSANILFQNNIVFGFVKMGLNINTGTNVTIDGNLIANIGKRSVIALDMAVDQYAGLSSCAYSDGDICTDIRIINNIVAGVTNSGFLAYGHTCNDYSSQNFFNNTAHSVQGTGAIIYPDPSSANQKQCMEGSSFYAYKNTLDGAVSYFKYSSVQYSNMIMIDNGFGPSINVGQEGDQLEARLKNIQIYGESLSRDCPVQNYCKLDSTKSLAALPSGCQDRTGLVISYFSTAGKQPFPTSSVSLPMHKVMSDASYGGISKNDGIKFIDFNSSTTYCGSNQVALRLNDDGADYHPRAKFVNTRFENVHQDAVAFMFSPPQGWANLDDCGDWPCSAPSNALLQFESTIYAGTVRPSDSDKSFQIIANNPQAVQAFDSCKFISKWNAYRCTNDNLGVLLFESLDDDKWKRMISPIYIKNLVVKSTNKLNTFMDHIWDGFYTGQLRMGRWPSIIQVGSTQQYEIAYSGTPPQNQRFTLNADYSGIIIKIDYTKPSAYAILDSNKKQIGANVWDQTLNAPALIKRTKCGENRYVGVVNILELYITSGCTLYIQPLDSIRCSVRLDWTLDQFFATGGTTKFIDRLTASLGIHASNVKIVTVYQGSVFVNFTLQENGTTPLIGGITQLKATISQLILTSQINLGAPILSADVSFVAIIPYDSKLIPNTDGGVINGDINKNNQGTFKPGQSVVVQQASSSDESNNQLKTIIIVSVIVGVILLGSVVAFMVYRKVNKNRQISSTNKNIPISQDSAVAISNVGPDDQYESQYHPKLEMGNIYGIGGQAQQYKANKDNNDSIQIQNDSNNDTENEENFQHDTNQSNVLGDVNLQEGTPLANLQEEDRDIKFKKRNTLTLDDNESGVQAK